MGKPAKGQGTGNPVCPDPAHLGSKVWKHSHRDGVWTYKCIPQGTSNHHFFVGSMPRRPRPWLHPDGYCPHCEDPIHDWQGKHAAGRYHFPVQQIARALYDLGRGMTYRLASQEARKKDGRELNPNDKRRTRPVGLDDPLYSYEAHLAMDDVEVFAEMVWRELVPPYLMGDASARELRWPEGGTVCVDSLLCQKTIDEPHQAIRREQLNRHRNIRREARQALIDAGAEREDFQESSLEELIEEFGLQDQFQGLIDDYNKVLEQGELASLERHEAGLQAQAKEAKKKPKEDAEAGRTLAMEDDTFKLANAWTGRGRQRGDALYEIIGAVGYRPGSKRGRLWRLAAYNAPTAADFAHFFRSLEGRPARIVCDQDNRILAGVALAWPDEGTRPQVYICEWHVMEALKRRIDKNERQLSQAKKQYLKRLIDQIYTLSDTKNPLNNRVAPEGSWLRLRPWARVIVAAQKLGAGSVAKIWRDPEAEATIRQLMFRQVDQVRTVGELEKALTRVGNLIWSRRARFRNRARTNLLMMLMQIHELRLDDEDRYAALIRQIIHEQLHGPPTYELGKPDKLGRRRGRMVYPNLEPQRRLRYERYQRDPLTGEVIISNVTGRPLINSDGTLRMPVFDAELTRVCGRLWLRLPGAKVGEEVAVPFTRANAATWLDRQGHRRTDARAEARKLRKKMQRVTDKPVTDGMTAMWGWLPGHLRDVTGSDKPPKPVANSDRTSRGGTDTDG